MSHNKSERQLANLFKNRRSVWIEEEDGQLMVIVKHGIRVEHRREAGTREEAERIAEELKAERRAAEIVNRLATPPGR